MKRLIISLLLFATASFATTINVPADQSTIQAGIDAASSGDTVLVAAGTYVENINYNGKNIALIGEDRETTIIDGNEDGSVVTFENGETTGSKLIGFTIQNGAAFGEGSNNYGGGIICEFSSPILDNLIIEDNRAGWGAGGIYFNTSSGELSNSIIRNNRAEAQGGGAYISSTSVDVLFNNVEITQNTVTDSIGPGSGAAVHIHYYSSAKFTNVTIANNTAISSDSRESALYIEYGSNLELVNSIIWGNSPAFMQFNSSGPIATIAVSYSNIEGDSSGVITNNYGILNWGSGNIDSDPLFVDATNGDYHLTSLSPCIDAGDPASDLDPDGTVADMGAYYYDQSSSATNTYSLNFDGVDDYVDLANKPITGVQNQFSILSYFKTNSLSINQGIYFHGGGYKDVGLRIDLEGSEYLLHFFILTSAGSQGHTYAPVGTIDTGVWHHAAGTYDGQDIKLYVDGNLIIETAFSTDVDWDQGTQYGPSIGGGNSQCPTFDGNIDEMSFWTVALSQTEIQSYMTTSPTGDETGLVGYWNFNEGSGTTLTDQTSNGNNGTIYGATWSTDVPFTGTTTTSALTWSVQAKVSLGSYNDNDNYLGVASNATNTFDAAYDEIEPPASPGSSISLYFPHPEWNSILGDNFSTDARPEIALTDTMQVWDFEVVSTDAGDATLTFVFSDVPSVPVILENTATGVRENLSNNETYTFTAVADSAHPFRISIGDTTAPALALGSSCTGPAILISDSTHSLGWTSTDGYEVDSVLVSFSSDSGTTYALQAALGTVSGYSWTVPDAVVMTAGKFKIKAQDYAGNNTEKISDYVFAIAGDSLSAAVTAGWTLWGVPINPANDTMSTNLNDDFTDYWVTYDYVNNGYTYDGILLEGEGYWLGAAQSATIDVKGTPIVSDFTMSLSQGWELISNPLVLDVSVDSLTFTKDATTKTHAEAVTAGWVNSIYGYSSTGYTAASTFAPWSGYWMAVLETGVNMTFPIHRHDGSGSARSREDDWMITFDAQVDGANDGTTMIGYAETATDGFDAEHDAVQPPNPPGQDYVSLFIAHPEWNYPLGDKFAKDIRATVPDDEYKEWLLSIESSESDVQLNWTLMNIPDDYEVGYNIDDGIYFNDMRSVGTINISADTEIIVRVGSQVLGIADETIPDVYALQQNYPNPFNPITTLRYDLPEQANVNIIIYDMLGRQVKTLINQTQDAGFKSVIWNATNDFGKPVSAGVYLYKIQAGEFVQTRKMVLLK